MSVSCIESTQHSRNRSATAVDLAMATWFMAVWIAARESGMLSVGSAHILLLVEGLCILAGILAGVAIAKDKVPGTGLSIPVRIGAVGLIGVVFVLLAIPVGLHAGVWWPVAVMVVLVGERLHTVIGLFRLQGEAFEDEHQRLCIEWVIRIPLMMLAIGLATTLPWPYLGVPPGAEDGMLRGDATVAPSHTLVVVGVLYYLLMAAVRYYAMGWLRRHVNR